MNVERLHAIANAIRDDLAATSAVATLQQLRDALQNQVNAPQEPSYQQQVAASLETLVSALEAAPSNNFPPTWVKVEEELGVDHLLGARLGAALRGIFERNQITASVATSEVNTLFAELQAASTQLDQLVAALTHFGIGAEELGPGEAEVAVLIPRPAVGNQLDQLGQEFQDLQRLLGPFLELGTGSRPALEVATISSSDFGIILDVAPKAAMFLAVAIERTVALYKTLLEVRKLRQEMADQGVPAEKLQGIDEHATSVMADGIEGIASELVANAHVSIDSGRQNELRVEVQMSLNGIANRIDAGFNIDVRAGDPVEDEETDEASAEADAVRMIRSASPNLRFINRSGKPILSLPEAPPPT